MDFESDDDLVLDTLKPGAGADSELEEEMAELLAQVGEEDSQAELTVAPADDGFGDLDALLGEAMAERSLSQSVIDARKRAKGGYALSQDDQARIRAWELAREWLPVANVALFHRYQCACGKHSTVYEGLMLEQKHRNNKTANRWTTQDASVANLPNRTAIRKSPVPVCPACAEPKGWKLSNAIEWEI